MIMLLFCSTNGEFFYLSVLSNGPFLFAYFNYVCNIHQYFNFSFNLNEKEMFFCFFCRIRKTKNYDFFQMLILDTNLCF